MLKIGITGGIGSGKSTVVKIFEQLGVPAFIADIEAKKVMVEDATLITGLKQNFGDQVYFDDGTLNRKLLADIVFNNPEKLATLNSLVHPAVFRSFDRWSLSFHKKPYLLKEAALLFESGSYQQNDFNILVTAPEDLRINRVMQRDGSSEDEVKSRIKNQFSEEEKLKLADYIILNDEKKALIPQVLTLHREFLKRADD
ncbi:dephospho-CoA kinase [Solitalea sp. MAHUQ-68]|uniref:Dephospho-CoA kinase n=2 Tax=Sphingobacteriaceae TaxID=84566 RepID=A0A9X2EYR6_9SPHI|nr:dephospho-CoA kinase [Solitalea agri]MCO4291479.1 dephospho-CoA kinase [Solitalea agri]